MKVLGDSNQKKRCYSGEQIENDLNKDYMR